MSSRLIDTFAKKAVEYMHNYKISDAEYLKAYDKLVERWIAATSSAGRKNILELKSWINQAIVKIAVDGGQL